MSRTRLFFAGREGTDIFLCEAHKQARLDAKERLGVPESAAAFMFGMRPWPTGEEPCVDCEPVGA